MHGTHRVSMLGCGNRQAGDRRRIGVGMGRGSAPYIGAQVVIGVLLLVCDLVLIAGLWFGYGLAGWTDDGSVAPEAQVFAHRTMWCLAGGAVITGGGLLSLRWRIPGTVQLIVLGIGALEFQALAAPH
ncbi:hypothetical protein AB0M19_13380 [Streptomyces sp. NPDC051920]|uniref:hypothetical protein n=1 Tax=Streptomyces sp. NPDC051920 TaxID=3155523 RepID=UPI0034328C05